MKRIHVKNYVITLIITTILVIAAFFISNYVNNAKTQELKNDEDKISVDMLVFENKFSQVKTASCDNFNTTELQSELGNLNSRLSFMEQQVGSNNPDVFRLRRYYSLLEIRDYLLTKKMSDNCKLHIPLILYLYPHKGDATCDSCRKQEYILQALQDEYSDVNIFSLDYDLDLSAIKTLLPFKNIPDRAPIVFINSTAYAPFDTLDDMKAVLSPLIISTTATSTKGKNQ